jgi:hypothetical protein
MPHPIVYAENALEGAILTMTPDGAVSGKGTERLIDRDIGLECEDVGVTGVRTWHADRGISAASLTIDAWLFAGAAYAGQLVTLASSADNTAWTTRGTVTPTADIPHAVPVTPFACPRYVRWTLTAPPAPVRFTEVWLSPARILSFPPTARHTQEPVQPNVVLVMSQSGRCWGIQRGARRWSTRYVLTVAPEADRTALYAMLDALQDGALPGWLVDVKGVLRWVRLSGALTLEAAAGLPVANWSIPLEFTEELP